MILLTHFRQRAWAQNTLFLQLQRWIFSGSVFFPRAHICKVYVYDLGSKARGSKEGKMNAQKMARFST